MERGLERCLRFSGAGENGSGNGMGWDGGKDRGNYEERLGGDTELKVLGMTAVRIGQQGRATLWGQAGGGKRNCGAGIASEGVEWKKGLGGEHVQGRCL